MWKKSRPDGTVEYQWRQVGEHWDVLDSLGQAMAAYASMGFATTGRETKIKRSASTLRRMRKRRTRVKVI